MEINVTVTKEQIIDAITSAWYEKESEAIDVIMQVDTDIAEWDFTIKCWLYFDAIIQDELKRENIYAKELKEQIESLRTGKQTCLRQT